MAGFETWRTAGLVLDIASGVLFVALGIAVMALRPRTRLNSALGVFAATLGTRAVLSNLDPAGLALIPEVPGWLITGVLGAHFVALVCLAAWFPRPLGPGDTLAAGLAALAAFVVFAVDLAENVPPLASQIGPLDAWMGDLNTAFRRAGAAGALVLFALRWRRAAAGSRERRELLVVSVAVATYFAVESAIFLGAGIRFGPLNFLDDLTAIVLAVAVAALWISNSARAPGDDGRNARRFALGLLTLALASLLFGVLFREHLPGDLGPNGLARVFSVAVLAYAILKHGLFDIDVKVKWGIRQSTLGAIFIAVFFVASEGAQALFSDRVGPAAGIVAAGALVFALAPLQRVAERVSNAAMPHVPTTPAAPAHDREAAYRTAVEIGLVDGALTRDEERALMKLATQLGIDAARAFCIREDAERDAAGGSLGLTR